MHILKTSLFFGLLLLLLIARLGGLYVITLIPRLIGIIFELIVHWLVVEPLYEHEKHDPSHPAPPPSDASEYGHLTHLDWSGSEAPKD